MPTTSNSIYEAAVEYANSVIKQLNATAADTIGTDVLWFRTIPDTRSQDVIFQSYTLYGVEDCPLEFKAVYTDTGYDDAAITYNILGINYAVPMTLEIALQTWEDATGHDGTIPKQHDIVYIPMTRKLLEVVSMQPVKVIAGQLSSYKVNLSIYQPTRNRVVGENLKESIKDNTTNLMEKFGEEIIDEVADIVDDKQLSVFDSTEKDKYKEVAETLNPVFRTSIRSEKIIVDGHTVARNLYRGEGAGYTMVSYKTSDSFTKSDGRCFSCWVRKRQNEFDAVIKNLKGKMSLAHTSDGYVLSVATGTKFKVGDPVVIQRGKMIVTGTVMKPGKILLDTSQTEKLNKVSGTWYDLPGFVLSKDNVINLLTGDNFSIDIKGGAYITLTVGDNNISYQFADGFGDMLWFGVILNLSEKLQFDVFSADGELKHKATFSCDNSLYDNIETESYSIKSGFADITNIRLYDVLNTDIDKQIMDLISYNVKDDIRTIINDTADTQIDKPYIGRQR